MKKRNHEQHKTAPGAKKTLTPERQFVRDFLIAFCEGPAFPHLRKDSRKREAIERMVDDYTKGVRND